MFKYGFLSGNLQTHCLDSLKLVQLEAFVQLSKDPVDCLYKNLIQ